MTKKYYWCHKEAGINPHIRQVHTVEESPRCATCHAVMTYGRYTDKIDGEFMQLLPGEHSTILGTTIRLESGILAQ